MVASTVAFFSSKNELEWLMQCSDFEQLKIVALTPEGDFSAREHNLKYTTIEDYYDEVQLNILGVASLPVIENICDEIDRAIYSTESKFTSHDLFVYIKLIYDQLLINHWFCKGLMKRESPDKIILINVPLLQKDIFVSDNQDLLLNTILYYFQFKNIPCKVVSIESQSKPKRKISISAKLAEYRAVLSNVKFALLSCFYNNVVSIRSPRIFIAQHWDFISCVGLQKEYKVYWLRNRLNFLSFRKKKAPSIDLDAFQKIMDSLSVILTFDEVSYFDLVRSKISYLVFSIRNEMNYHIDKLYNFMKSKKIEAIIAASGQSLEILASLRAAKSLDIPIIWGQHGGLYGYGEFPINEYINKIYSHYFLSTEAVGTIASTKPMYAVSDNKLLAIYYAIRLKK